MHSEPAAGCPARRCGGLVGGEVHARPGGFVLKDQNINTKDPKGTKGKVLARSFVYFVSFVFGFLIPAPPAYEVRKINTVPHRLRGNPGLVFCRHRQGLNPLAQPRSPMNRAESDTRNSLRYYLFNVHQPACHFLTQAASIRSRRFFLRFSCITRRRMGSGLTSHFSIRVLPGCGAAATATLQQ